MSYILDALKKSEAERAAQATARSVPELAAAQVMPVTSRSRLLIPVLIALVVLLIGLLGYLLMSSSQPTADFVVEAEVAPQVSLVSERPPVATVVMEETTLPRTSAPATVTPERSAARPAGSAPVDALRRIPDLEISGHLFSSVADKRRVTMNGRDWREGDLIADGIVLSEITQDGITLSVDGWPVIVGRSRGWKAIR